MQGQRLAGPRPASIAETVHDLTIVREGAKAGEWESIFVVSPANYPLLRGHMGWRSTHPCPSTA